MVKGTLEHVMKRGVAKGSLGHVMKRGCAEGAEGLEEDGGMCCREGVVRG